jgi:hypothetical protein
VLAASARKLALPAATTQTVKYPIAKARGFYRPVSLWAACLSLEQDSSGRVVVTIQFCAAFTGMPAFVQVFGYQLTTIAAHLAGIVGIHKHHLPSGAFSLGDTERLELSPPSIENGFVEASLSARPIRQIGALFVWIGFGFGRFAHIENVEVFENEQTEAIHERTSCFVLKVLPQLSEPCDALLPMRSQHVYGVGSHASSGPWPVATT